MTEKVALLLEDEALIAMDVGQTLMDVGYFVHTFSSCAMALDWLRGAPPSIDIAVIDVQLTDGPCDDVAREIVARGIPFIVHSADTISAAPDVGPFSAGIWLPKPSATEQLLEAIQQAAAR